MIAAAWWLLFGAAATGTVLVISFYLHWSFRWQHRRLGVTAEVSFLLFVVLLGGAAFLSTLAKALSA